MHLSFTLLHHDVFKQKSVLRKTPLCSWSPQGCLCQTLQISSSIRLQGSTVVPKEGSCPKSNKSSCTTCPSFQCHQQNESPKICRTNKHCYRHWQQQVLGWESDSKSQEQQHLSNNYSNKSDAPMFEVFAH